MFYSLVYKFEVFCSLIQLQFLKINFFVLNQHFTTLIFLPNLRASFIFQLFTEQLFFRYLEIFLNHFSVNISPTSQWTFYSIPQSNKKKLKSLILIFPYIKLLFNVALQSHISLHKFVNYTIFNLFFYHIIINKENHRYFTNFFTLPKRKQTEEGNQLTGNDKMFVVLSGRPPLCHSYTVKQTFSVYQFTIVPLSSVKR